MTTTEIKCECGCTARIVISEDNLMRVYYEKGIGDWVHIPQPIAEAIRAAVKAMEDDY